MVKSWNPEYPYAVEIPTETKYYEDEFWVLKRNNLKDRHFAWLHELGLKQTEDFLYYFVKPPHVLHYQFKNRAVALLFKLRWQSSYDV